LNSGLRNDPVPRPVGVRVKHATLRNKLFVVENSKHLFTDGGYDCNQCAPVFGPVHHYGKATHLWLEPDGTALVSVGALEELKRAGMPNLRVIDHTNEPPTLRLGRNAERQVVDNDNRRIWVPTPRFLRTARSAE
jgi:hypothetical protein